LCPPAATCTIRGLAKNIYRVSAISELFDGTAIVNTFHYTHDRGDDPGPDQLLDEWHAAHRAPYLALLPDNSNLLRLHALQVPDQDQVPLGSPTVAELQEDAAGTRVLGDQELSPGLCCVATFRTAIGTRRTRGRMFCPPGLDSGLVSPNRRWVTTANYYLDRCKTFCADVVAGLESEYDFVVYSPTGAEAGQDAFKVITSYSLPNRQHWLRSRGDSPP